MLVGVFGNTNRLFGCGKATGKVFIVLSSPPNHLEREGKEEPPRAHHRDHDHLPAPLHTLCVGQGAACRDLSRRMEEEEIDGLSFVAFLRTATLLHLPVLSTPSATQQVVDVDPLE